VFIVDEFFHEKEVDLKFIPDIGSIIEIALDKSGKTRARYKIMGVASRSPDCDMIPELHVKWIGRS